MISLRDTVEINATPKQLFAWLERMPKEYKAWHPDHVACRVLHGSMLEIGSVIECKEYLHGKLHSMKFRVLKVAPYNRVEFVIVGMGRGAFEAEEKGDGVRFIAELDIGSDVPIIGGFFDFIFRTFFNARIEDMNQHLVEEGQNLKAILEEL